VSAERYTDLTTSRRIFHRQGRNISIRHSHRAKTAQERVQRGCGRVWKSTEKVTAKTVEFCVTTIWKTRTTGGYLWLSWSVIAASRSTEATGSLAVAAYRSSLRPVNPPSCLIWWQKGICHGCRGSGVYPYLGSDPVTVDRASCGPVVPRLDNEISSRSIVGWPDATPYFGLPLSASLSFLLVTSMCRIMSSC
jgi:hypothetical protein